MARGYNQGMEPNPYEAPDVPSDAPRDDIPPVVLAPSWLIIAAILIAAAGILIALFSEPVKI
jgi:hypothetical protein